MDYFKIGIIINENCVPNNLLRQEPIKASIINDTSARDGVKGFEITLLSSMTKRSGMGKCGKWYILVKCVTPFIDE